MTALTRVIKVGGRPQGDPSLPAAIARNWDASTRPMVVVHGGGDEVTSLQTAFGATAQFIDGRRVTSATDVEIVRMALAAIDDADRIHDLGSIDCAPHQFLGELLVIEGVDAPAQHETLAIRLNA